jgi:dTDP-4-dehydrorhamnose reductase
MKYNPVMKILITGADGALGREMQKLLRKEHINYRATDINQLDITNFKKAHESILDYRPDVILHFAALSDVDVCEENAELALSVNALGSLGLAVGAKKLGAKILYTSTNYVFDGNTETPYFEYSDPHPINEYGRTKLLGEQYIRDICDRYFIARTSWLFGAQSKNFIPQFLLAENKPHAVATICDLFATFTYIPDLAEALLQLIKSENYGVYHLVNKGIGSWFDFALKAKALMKFKTEINPTKVEELHLHASRPRFTPLGSRNFEFLFNRNMRTWEDALVSFTETILKRK